MKILEKLKHPTEKTKHRLQGVGFGFLAGAILTFVIVGFVGCSMTEESKQPNESQRHAIGLKEKPSKAWENGGAISFNIVVPQNSTSTFRASMQVSSAVNQYGQSANYFTNSLSFSYLGAFSESLGGDLTSEYEPYRNTYSGSSASFIYDSSPLIANMPYGLFLFEYGSTYQNHNNTAYIDLRTLPMDLSDYYIDFNLTGYAKPIYRGLVDWQDVFKPLSDLVDLPTPSSSSVESSGEFSSLDRSLIYTFGDGNPFSAWARNPMSHDPATNYDGGAPWLLYTGKPSGNGATTSVTAEARDFLVGEFYVEGNPSSTFDTIQITTLNLSTDNAFVLNGGTEAVQISTEQFERGAFMITNIKYVNSVTDNSLSVYNFGSTSATLNGQSVNALTNGAWANVGYKTIVWSGGDLTLTINGYEAPASWWLEFNALSSQSAVATMILGNASTGVFGLIASAFSAWGSIFGLAIVPGLTIGTLLFVPVVVLIVFAIIKLLQK